MPIKIVERRHFNPDDGSIAVASGAGAGTGAAFGPTLGLGVGPAAAAGAGSALDPSVLTDGGITFGFNVSSSLFGFTESLQQCHDRYLSSYNLTVLPIAKMFHNALPTAWSSTFGGVVSGRRVIICYTAKTSVANAAAGDMDAEVASYFASVPRDWYVIAVFMQEPNDDLQKGSFSATDYKNAYKRHYAIIKAQQKAANPGAGLHGNRLEMWSCFINPLNLGMTAAATAAWLPDPTFNDGADGGYCDGYGWDCYLNPNGQQLPGHTGDTRYNTDYAQFWSARMQAALDANALKGMQRWGIMEAGAPWRNWDTGATTRDTVMTAGFDYCKTPPQGLPAEHFLMFDSLGTQWDQRIVADGIPTQFDHRGGPGGPDVPGFVAVPATPDEPLRVTYETRIKGGVYNQFVGPA